MAIESLLKTFKYDIDTAFNGEEALRKIEERHQNRCCARCKSYSLIFMDINIPIMDGYESTIKIREMIKKDVWDHSRIVGCTAFVTEEKLKQCLESGMDSYINKPLKQNKDINYTRSIPIRVAKSDSINLVSKCSSQECKKSKISHPKLLLFYYGAQVLFYFHEYCSTFVVNDLIQSEPTKLCVCCP